MSIGRNVVWATLDSVRADHTSVHGYDRETTPRMATVGEDGAVLERCFSHSVATAASSASILTGAYPSKHGVAMGEAVGTIPDALHTAAELFGDAGYRTACVTTNPRLRLIGGDRGFDEFYDISRSTLLRPERWRTTARFLRNLRRHSVGLSLDGLSHSFALVVNDLATRWVRSVTDAGEEPFFLYVHYNEPHRPYEPPLSYRSRFTDGLDRSPEECVALARDLHDEATRRIAEGLPLSAEDWAAVTAMYDAEIAYADEMVGRLLDSIRSLVDREPATVVTADHGELLGERDLFGHFYEPIDALVHVPTVVRGVPEVTGRHPGVVQHADLMKTLLLASGTDAGQFDAVDLRTDERPFAVSQEYVPDYDSYESRSEAFDAGGRPIGAVDALRTREFRLLTHDRGTELYRLPDESTEVGDSFPAVRGELTDALREWREAYGRPVGERPAEDDYDERTRRRLADLGYLE